VLASLGEVRPEVRRRPTVAVLSTGDEVVPPETGELRAGAVRDANRVALTGMLDGLADVVDMGIVGDDEDRLRETFADAASRADVVVTSGGVSMGVHDLVKVVLGDLGGVEFWKVAMQPGKPFAFGAVHGTPLFGLPGNPVSVTIAFEQFVRPALLHRMRARLVFRERVPAVLGEAVETGRDRTVFLRVTVERRSDTLVASPSGAQGSNILSALARADAFAVVPVGTAGLPAGAPIELELFRSPERRTIEEVLG
jgi:molybdopterin molybdotransferase